MITPDLLRSALGCTAERAAVFAHPISEACALFEINTADRLAMFLANIGHESGALKYTAEIWGPTEAQRRYEGRRDLGNTEPGDGERYKGHGLIQTTGRANHRELQPALLLAGYEDVPDFEADPDALTKPRWAAASAGYYWASRGINRLADAGDFDGACDVINRGRKTEAIGDSNGYADRLQRLARARFALAAAQPAVPPPVAPVQPAPAPAPAVPVRSMPAGEFITEEPITMAPFIAAALPAIIESIPKLGRLFGSGSEVSERNVKAAELAVSIVQEATGAVNAQQAAEKLKADPVLLQQAAQAIEARWLELAEAGGGGIAGARQADAAFVQGKGDIKHSPSFWVALALLPLVYMIVGAVVGLIGAPFSDDVRSAIANGVVGLILGGLIGYYYGQTTTRNRTGGQ
jgi:putative chitinase